MKKIFYILIFSLSINCSAKLITTDLKNGDLIFHESKSSQSDELKILTGSKYTHVGIIYFKNKQPYVMEAVQPVKFTPLNEWINRGKGSHFVVKRLKNQKKILTKENLLKMKKIANKFIGKNYDFQFLWSDKKIYCSELVFKIYKDGAGCTIGKIQHFKDFNLFHPKIKLMIKKRFNGNIPLNEPVITPVSIFESNLLYTVIEK